MCYNGFPWDMPSRSRQVQLSWYPLRCEEVHGWSKGKWKVMQGHFDSIAYINWIIYDSRETKYSLFISLNPWLETLINLIQHCLIKLKCQTQLDNFDKLQEMYVILVFFLTFHTIQLEWYRVSNWSTSQHSSATVLLQCWALKPWKLLGLLRHWLL